MSAVIPAVVQEHLSELRQLCERYRVRRLELFGSATSPRFDPSSSDLDFLVEFEDLRQGYFDAYFGLLESLEELFGKPVDLVMSRAVKNPYFLEGIQASRTLLYAA
jgi:predicted nucleotidyltransferase